MKKVILFAALAILALFVSCDKNGEKLSPKEQLEKDIKEIKEYISDKGLDAKETNSGLHYVINKEGTRNYPYANDNVTVRYKGYTIDGKVFDQSDEEGITFNLQQVIKG